MPHLIHTLHYNLHHQKLIHPELAAISLELAMFLYHQNIKVSSHSCLTGSYTIMVVAVQKCRWHICIFIGISCLAYGNMEWGEEASLCSKLWSNYKLLVIIFFIMTALSSIALATF